MKSRLLKRPCGRWPHILLLIFLVTVFLASSANMAAAQSPSPAPAPAAPGQPASGPGGSDYKYATVKTSSYGSGDEKYWIYEPDSPPLTSAPVIVFNHGYMGMDPQAYLNWIYHLVRQGNIVIYPVYQEILSDPEGFTAMACTAVKNALETLKSDGHVLPETDKYAIAGHSLGGVLTVNMATQAESYGLPVPKALMLVEATDGSNIIETDLIPVDFTSLPEDILMIAIAAADDTVAGSDFSRRAILESTRIPAANKNMILMHTDNHGSPGLAADHIAPLSPLNEDGTLGGLVMNLIGAGTDALDYYGFWKLFDGLTQAAFGINPDSLKYALGDTPEQRFMGLWNDGTPVTELEIVTDPGNYKAPAANTLKEKTGTLRTVPPQNGLPEIDRPTIDLPEIHPPQSDIIQELKDNLPRFDQGQFDQKPSGHEQFKDSLKEVFMDLCRKH